MAGSISGVSQRTALAIGAVFAVLIILMTTGGSSPSTPTTGTAVAAAASTTHGSMRASAPRPAAFPVPEAGSVANQSPATPQPAAPPPASTQPTQPVVHALDAPAAPAVPLPDVGSAGAPVPEETIEQQAVTVGLLPVPKAGRTYHVRADSSSHTITEWLRDENLLATARSYKRKAAEDPSCAKNPWQMPTDEQVTAFREAGEAALEKLRVKEYPLHVWEPDANLCPHIARFGKKSDGGWETCVSPAVASGECVVYAVGVGTDASFDGSIAKHTKCKIVSLDPTPRSVAYMAGLNLPKNLEFHPWGLATETTHAMMSNSWTGHKPVEVSYMTFADITSRLKHKDVTVVKLDIEGVEFDVLSEMSSDAALGVEQILLEMHFAGIDFKKDGGARRSLDGPSVWLDAMAQLYEAGFRLFAKEKGRYHTRGKTYENCAKDPKCPGALQEFSLIRTRRPECV